MLVFELFGGEVSDGGVLALLVMVAIAEVPRLDVVPLGGFGRASETPMGYPQPDPTALVGFML